MLNNKQIPMWGSVILLILALSAPACSLESHPKTEKIDAPNSALANPATKKCADDGYILGSIKRNGIPSTYICKNPANGKKCETWKYFRGECKLD